jgi:hypothetical protein
VEVHRRPDASRHPDADNDLAIGIFCQELECGIERDCEKGFVGRCTEDVFTAPSQARRADPGHRAEEQDLARGDGPDGGEDLGGRGANTRLVELAELERRQEVVDARYRTTTCSA